jgi:hypothetical protein
MVRAKIRMPRGMGMLTNPRRALYNRVYNRTSVSIDQLIKGKPHSVSQSNFMNTTPSYSKGIQTDNMGNIIRSSSKALTVTSKNFEELRNQITEIYTQREALLKRLNSAKAKLLGVTLIHVASYIVIVGFFYKRIAEIRVEQKVVVNDLEKEIAETFVALNFADKSQLEKSWLNCVDAFAELMKSEKIWDLTYAEDIDRVKARTTAKTVTKRTIVTLSERKIEFIKSDLPYLFLPNANGPDLFFYPTFLLLFKDNEKFGLFDLKEISGKFELTRYIEEEKVPGDTEIINYTWKKSNKDGSKDKRYNGNYQIPVVKYGDVSLTTETGLEEEYMFSNFEAFVEFGKAFQNHLQILEKYGNISKKER